MKNALKIVCLVSFLFSVFSAGVCMISLCILGIVKIREMKKSEDVQSLVKNVSGRFTDYFNNRFWKKEIIE